MKQLALMILGLGLLVAIGVRVVRLGEPRLQRRELAPVWQEQPTVITMLCSDEKEEWVRRMVSEFAKHRPDIEVKLEVMSSMKGLDALLGRETTPMIWSPSETNILRYLNYRWQREFGAVLFEEKGEDAPKSLARSPVVWLSWKSRIEAIQAAMRAGTMNPQKVWADVACAGVPSDPAVSWIPKLARWDELPAFQQASVPSPPRNARQKQSQVSPMTAWGDIKFSYADPTHSTSGFIAIYLMSHQFLEAPDLVTTAMLDGAEYLDWFRRCQRIPRDFPSSARVLTNRVFQFGPDKYDIVVTHENLALRYANLGQSRWTEDPFIYYPPLTVWSDHPIVILDSKGLPREQREAARDWIAFLLGPEPQRELITFGLRPVREDVSIGERQNRQNPFLNSVRFNVQIDAKFSEPPALPGNVIDRMLQIWREATGLY